MMDVAPRSPIPYGFDPDRLPHEYIHFGHGAAPVLRHPHQPGRAATDAEAAAEARQPPPRRGRAGRLRKQGPFAVELNVRYD